MYKKILIAADHAGYPLKKALIELNPNLPWQDLGTHSESSVDYPDFANQVAEKLPKDTKDKSVTGVLICGSGQGMAIRANRFKHVRAALCWNAEIAELSRQHNDANVLCMGARFLDAKQAHEILTTFLNTTFDGGERHERRVTKLSQNC